MKLYFSHMIKLCYCKENSDHSLWMVDVWTALLSCHILRAHSNITKTLYEKLHTGHPVSSGIVAVGNYSNFELVEGNLHDLELGVHAYLSFLQSQQAACKSFSMKFSLGILMLTLTKPKYWKNMIALIWRTWVPVSQILIALQKSKVRYTKYLIL